jgi:hypothetical protein
MNSPDGYPFTVFIAQLSMQFADNSLASGVALFWLPVAILFFVIFAAWMVFYGERLSIAEQ